MKEIYNIQNPLKFYFNSQIIDWERLAEYFRWLHTKYKGYEKMSCGSLSINFDPQGKCSVELGGYSMPLMARHEYIKSETELEAWSRTLDKIESNRQAIVKEQDDNCDRSKKENSND